MRRLVRKRKQNGFATLLTLVLVSLAVTAVVIATDVSLTQVRLATRSENRLKAMSLAEAGVDDAVERLRGDRTFAGTTATLYADPPTNSLPLGSFQTSLTTLSADTRKVVSVGTNPNGTTDSVVAVVEIPRQKLGSVAAIQATEGVDISGTAAIGTLAGTLHNADVQSNGAIHLGGSSNVDGTLSAVGTVTAPDYDSGQVFATSVSGASPIPFPADTDVADMMAALRIQAQAGTHYNTVNQTTTITAPAYINGDMTIDNNDTVQIVGTGVVYVTGNVRLNGQATLENSGTLAVEGTVIQSGSSVYRVTSNTSPTPTLVVFNQSHYVPAVSLSGGSSTVPQGIVYAAQGGIRFESGSVFVGSLIAGGADGTVSVSGDFTLLYPEGMQSSIEFPGIPNVNFWGEM